MGCASPTAGTSNLEIVTAGPCEGGHQQLDIQQQQVLNGQQQAVQVGERPSLREKSTSLLKEPDARGRRGPSDKPDSKMRRGFHAEYQLGSKLGKGAFAQVFLTRHLAANDGIQMAVKVMDLRQDRSNKPRSELEPIDPKRASAVEVEVKILAKVAGLPHAIRMTDSFLDGCFSYIVMEKCDKTLLIALESMSMLNEYTVKRIFYDMLEGLKSIHAMGVIHRDVKPDNFLCVGDCTVKLCDFGLASTCAPGQALSGVYGTPPYMAPEMLCAQGYNGLADVWSVGVIAYVLLFGQFPYKPAEPSGKAMKAAIKAGIPEPTFRPKPRLDTGGGPGITEEGRQWLMKMLVRNPALRPHAAAALQTPWINDAGTPDLHEKAASLRPMLYAARRAGAFDPPRNDKEVDKTGLDALMAELQAKHSSSRPTPTKGGKSSVSCASTETSSMSASDRSGHSSVDFQAPGVVSGSHSLPR